MKYVPTARPGTWIQKKILPRWGGVWLIVALISLGPRAGWAREGAQAMLPRILLGVAGTTLEVEVADDPGELAAGLMFREHLEDGRGMLFVMPRVGPASFWMKNTSIPLSIGYVSESGILLEIHDLEPFDESTVQSQSQKIRYAIEVPRGWFSRNSIFPGDRITGLERVEKE